MSEKSFVAMGVEVCPACGNTHSETVLLNKRGIKSFESKQYCTGKSFCPDCSKKIEDGYTILIEVDASKSRFNGDGTRATEMYRTGRLAAVKRESWARVFNVPDTGSPVVAIDQEGFAKLKGISDAA